jgi:hypothetical protein
MDAIMMDSYEFMNISHCTNDDRDMTSDIAED